MFVIAAELSSAVINCPSLFEWYSTEIVYASCFHPAYYLNGLFRHKHENKTERHQYLSELRVTPFLSGLVFGKSPMT